jgi:hypothetical protein
VHAKAAPYDSRILPNRILYHSLFLKGTLDLKIHFYLRANFKR